MSCRTLVLPTATARPCETLRLMSRNIKGASIYDVRIEGGRVVPSKADIVSNLSKGGCVNLRTGGVKKCENFADVIYGSPLMRFNI